MRVKECLYTTIHGDECEFKYLYRLIEQDFYGVQVYGIEVEKEDIVDRKEIGIERDSVNIISPDENKVRKLLNMLYNYKVSPIHLIDIIGEYVDEYVSDFDNCNIAITNA